MENNEFLKIFNELYNLNINDKVEKKQTGAGKSLSYLSWSYAVAEFTKKFPNFKYEIEYFDNKPYLYDENLGYMVFTKIEVNGMSKEMWLPVMDEKNKAMKKEKYTYKTKFGDKEVEPATMFEINKTIMRCLVKNMAMFGLGLYIYNGEDLPETETEINPVKQKVEKPKEEKPKEETPEQKYVNLLNKKKIYSDELRIAFNKMEIEDKRKEYERVKNLNAQAI
jgi:hypothetical protein